MTRKDYMEVAKLIRAEMGDFTDLFDRQTREVIASIAVGLADIFQVENPRFDRQRFYYHAGLTEQGKANPIHADS